MRSRKRAPRIGLRGSLSLTIRLENGRQIPARVHQLSVTGGLLELANYLEERTRVGLTLTLGSGTVNPKAEMLFPMLGAQGYLQPFRFTGLWAEERLMLEAEIAELLRQSVARSTPKQGLGPRPRPFYLDSF